MKKIFTLLVLTTLLFTINSQAQTSTCYEKYREALENRGAFPVNDGVHENVILTIRSEEISECVYCDVTVKNAEIVQIVVVYDDDTKDILTYDFKDNGGWTIFNGITKTRVTTEEEKINVMFINKIKPKKKKMKKAPMPDFELN